MKELLFNKLDNRKGGIRVVDCDNSVYSQVEAKLGIEKDSSMFVANIKKNELAIKESTGIEAILGRKIVVDDIYLEEDNIVIDDSVHIDAEIMSMLLENISEDSNIIVLGDVNCIGIDNNAFDACREYVKSKNKNIEVVRNQETISDKNEFVVVKKTKIQDIRIDKANIEEIMDDVMRNLSKNKCITEDCTLSEAGLYARKWTAFGTLLDILLKNKISFKRYVLPAYYKYRVRMNEEKLGMILENDKEDEFPDNLVIRIAIKDISLLTEKEINVHAFSK